MIIAIISYFNNYFTKIFGTKPSLAAIVSWFLSAIRTPTCHVLLYKSPCFREKSVIQTSKYRKSKLTNLDCWWFFTDYTMGFITIFHHHLGEYVFGTFSIEDSQSKQRCQLFWTQEKKTQANNQHPWKQSCRVESFVRPTIPRLQIFHQRTWWIRKCLPRTWVLGWFQPFNFRVGRRSYWEGNFSGAKCKNFAGGWKLWRCFFVKGEKNHLTKLGPRGASNFRGIYLGRSWGWRTTSNEFGTTFERRISWLKDHISKIMYDIFQVFQDIESVCISQRLNVWSI